MALVEGELTGRIIGCSMAVHNSVGHGLREKTYERALCVELDCQGIAYSAQSAYPVLYRGQRVDDFVPDMVVEDRVLVDVKSIAGITDVELGQMLCYLRVTGLKVGLIVNFRNAKLEWERVVLDKGRA